MVGALMNRFNLPQEEAAKVSRIAQGNFLAAQSLIRDNEEREFFQEMFVQWMRFLWQKEFFSLMQWSETMSKIGRERQMQFFRYGLHIFRESLILNYADSSIQMSGGKEMDFLQKFSPYVNELNALDMVSMFEEAIHHISRNANPQIMIMDISLKMMKLVRKKVS
jgi:DNA polymerase-3 subunit delta'